MEAILARPAKVRNPEYSDQAAAEAKANGDAYDVPKWIEAPAGTRVSNPKAHRLVQLGMATPGDDECRKACRMTEGKVEAALVAQEKMSKGIADTAEKAE